MPLTPEQRARERIDRLLAAAGWIIQDNADFNRNAGEGVAVREFLLPNGPCDYLLFVGGKAAGVIEAKKSGCTLSGVAEQAAKYLAEVPAHLARWSDQLVFAYESNGCADPMATGAGKTFTACTFSWRLLKHAKASRILFLVDRTNLGDQTLKEYQNHDPPGSGRKFNQTYIVQHLHSNRIDPDAKIVITTIQRLYATSSWTKICLTQSRSWTTRSPCPTRSAQSCSATGTSSSLSSSPAAPGNGCPRR